MFPKVLPDLKYWLLLQCVGGFTLYVRSLQLFSALLQFSYYPRKWTHLGEKQLDSFYDDYDYFSIEQLPFKQVKLKIKWKGKNKKLKIKNK